ncbi:unnamed protein product [Calypogeia fissa]
MEVFWRLGRDPCAMARVTSARRRDQLPFWREDLVAGHITHTQWWDKYYPSANVMDWLDKTADPGDIDGYFGPYNHREAGMVPLNYTAPFAKGSVSGCRLAGSPDPQEYLYVWNPAGPPLMLQQDRGHNAFQVGAMNWSDSIVQNQETIETLMDPQIFRLYVFGRLLREATKATGKGAPSISLEGVSSDRGWQLYPLFASLGPEMVRMYNWLVAVGFIYNEDPLLRRGSRRIACFGPDDLPIEKMGGIAIRLGANGLPVATRQPDTSNGLPVATRQPDTSNGLPVATRQPGTSNPSVRAPTFQNLIIGNSGSSVEQPMSEVKLSTLKNRQRKICRKTLEEANARSSGDVEAMETSDREEQTAVTLPLSPPRDQQEIPTDGTIEALLNLSDSEMIDTEE